MGKIIIHVSDELESHLLPFMEHIEEILELGLREYSPTHSPMYEEVLTFLAAGPSSTEIAQYKSSNKILERVSELLEKNRDGELNELEMAELDLIQKANHFMTLLKARARRRSKNS